MRVQGTGGSFNAEGGELLVSAYGTGDVTISLTDTLGDITHTLHSTDATAHQLNILLHAGDIVATGAANSVTINTTPNNTQEF